MGAIRRLYETAGWAIIIAAFMAAVGHSAPESPDGYWRSKLNAIRELAMARPKPQGQKIAVLKPGVVTAIKPAAEPAPQPTKQAEVVVNLTSTFNKHLKTRITFQANGWNIWASAGLNPDNPDGDYLILQVEDKASIVFDIRSMITLTEQLKAFGVNGVPMVLVGEGVVKWGNPERDSTLGVAVNINNDPDPSVRLKEPKIGKEPNYLLKPFTMDDFRKALWDAGTPVQVGAEEIRFYYGDQVSKGERRLQT